MFWYRLANSWENSWTELQTAEISIVININYSFSQPSSMSARAFWSNGWLALVGQCTKAISSPEKKPKWTKGVLCFKGAEENQPPTPSRICCLVFFKDFLLLRVYKTHQNTWKPCQNNVSPRLSACFQCPYWCSQALSMMIPFSMLKESLGNPATTQALTCEACEEQQRTRRMLVVVVGRFVATDQSID